MWRKDERERYLKSRTYRPGSDGVRIARQGTIRLCSGSVIVQQCGLEHSVLLVVAVVEAPHAQVEALIGGLDGPVRVRYEVHAFSSAQEHRVHCNTIKSQQT